MMQAKDPAAHAPANCSETAVTTYSYSVDDESFLGEFDSPEAAAEAGFCDDPELQVISVAENCKDTAHRYVSADYILEDAAGRACDECGEAADDWLDGLMHNLDKKAELERIVGDWLQTQEPPKFSRVKNPRAVTRAEMIAAGKLAADQA